MCIDMYYKLTFSNTYPDTPCTQIHIHVYICICIYTHKCAMLVGYRLRAATVDSLDRTRERRLQKAEVPLHLT